MNTEIIYNLTNYLGIELVQYMLNIPKAYIFTHFYVYVFIKCYKKTQSTEIDLNNWRKILYIIFFSIHNFHVFSIPLTDHKGMMQLSLFIHYC